jgi:hypothetical protein
MDRLPTYLLALGTLLLSTCAFAYDFSGSYDGVKFTVEPIVGFEWAPRTDPTQHLHSQLTYGARLIAGVHYLSLEGEYTHATDQEDFGGGFSTNDTDERAKLGLRSGYNLNSFFEAHARAGAEASRNKHEDTVGGITTTTYNPVEYHPYVGAGFRFTITPRTYATADVTVTIHDLHDMTQNEYQTTAGVAVQFP